MMTSATKRLGKARWADRAIQVAQEHHLVHRARDLGVGVHGESLWEVPSKSYMDGSYIVHMWPATMGVVCSCLAMSLGHGCACSHAGAALTAERRKQAAERGSEGDTAMRRFAHGGEW